jgi:hypothetical protein
VTIFNGGALPHTPPKTFLEESFWISKNLWEVYYLDFALCAAPMYSACPRGALPTTFGAMLHFALSCGEGAPHGILLFVDRTEPQQSKSKNFQKFLEVKKPFFQKGFLRGRGSAPRPRHQ